MPRTLLGSNPYTLGLTLGSAKNLATGIKTTQSGTNAARLANIIETYSKNSDVINNALGKTVSAFGSTLGQNVLSPVTDAINNVNETAKKAYDGVVNFVDTTKQGISDNKDKIASAINALPSEAWNSSTANEEARKATAAAWDRQHQENEWLWNKQMEAINTSYERAVASLKAAGLNPILAYSNGGLGTPSVSTGSFGSAQTYKASESTTDILKYIAQVVLALISEN